LKTWLQRTNGRVLEASLRSGLGVNEVFYDVAKSWRA
jgi:hypothetical protein